MKLSTIKSLYCKEYAIKKSRFIASLSSVSSENAAKDLLKSIKEKHRNATHHPFAYRIGFENIIERYSDDGEPPRSSGFPILRELQNAHLTNVMLTVTRYFGGIKLGLGGLSRAYRESAASVIRAANRSPVIPLKRLELSMPQEHAGKVRNLLQRFKARILKEDYGKTATYLIETEKENSGPLVESINNLTHGRATITPYTENEEN